MLRGVSISLLVVVVVVVLHLFVMQLCGEAFTHAVWARQGARFAWFAGQALYGTSVYYEVQR